MERDREAGTLLMQMLDACHSPIDEAWAALHQTFQEVLYARLAEGHRAHASALEALNADGVCPPASDRRSERLMEYRTLVTTSFMEPVSTFLLSGVSARVLNRLDEGISESILRMEDLPESLVVAWPEDALGRREGDAIVRRVAKAVGRRISAARKGGSRRSVACRVLSRSHVAADLCPGERRAALEMLSGWGEWVGAWTGILAEWGDVALPALVRLERKGGKNDDAWWSGLCESGERLQEELGRLLADTPTALACTAWSSRQDELAARLTDEFGLAGSFLERRAENVLAADLASSFPSRASLESWDRAVQSRLELYIRLVAVLSGTAAVQGRVVSRFRDECLTEIAGLGEIADELDRFAGRIRAGDFSQPANYEVAPILAKAMVQVPSSDLVEQLLTAGADALVDSLFSLVRQVPVRLDLPLDGTRPPRPPRLVETRPIMLQEIARKSLDAWRMERLRSTSLGLSGAVDRIRDTVAGLDAVYAFAHSAAAEAFEASDPDTRLEGQEMVAESLESMAKALRHEVARADRALGEVRASISQEIGDGILALIDRVAAGRVQAQLFAAQSRFAEVRARLLGSVRPPVQRGLLLLTRFAHRLKSGLSRGMIRGSEIVGGARGDQPESFRSIKELADTALTARKLPLVYHRLFSLDPLVDLSLLAGRLKELEAGLDRWRRWRVKDGSPMIVHARQGCGTTTFINALLASIEEEGGSVLSVQMNDRVSDERVFARFLAERLSLPTAEGLSDLASSIFEAPAGSLPNVVALDNLEHLFLRTPGGSDLIERLLTLMAETEPRLFWVGGITTSAWQLVAAVEPTAVSQVELVQLGPLTPAAIREAIGVRHRRSGLPLRFEGPVEGRTVLRRRLSQARTTEDHQNLVADTFFEQLGRTSGGDLRLALFQWLQVADFGSGQGVRISPVERPSFSVLESLTLTQNFTLKAFLEHRTLTLAEHDKIFRLPRSESFQIFESLGNRHLIRVQSPDVSGEDTRPGVQADLRYQIQPLLVGAITSHLRARNIVH